MPASPAASRANEGGPALPLFSGVVLAAGCSSRMGRDKALLETCGQPLWRRQREVLAAAGVAQIFLSARDTQPWAHAASAQFAAVVRDVENECGPLGGITAALDRATHPWLVVMAIDLPNLTEKYLRRIMALVRAGRGVVPAWPDGRTEPLCAVYPRTAATIATRRLEQRRLKLQEFVEALESAGLIERVLIAPADAGLFVNWNEPADASSDAAR